MHTSEQGLGPSSSLGPHEANALLVRNLLEDLADVYKLPPTLESYLIERYVRTLSELGWRVTHESCEESPNNARYFACEITKGDETLSSGGETKLIALVRVGGQAPGGWRSGDLARAIA